jgi:hypothetical protein
MAKQATHSDRSDVTSFPLMPAFNSAFLDTFMRTGETCVMTYLVWQDELFRFTASRLLQDEMIGRAFASSKTLDEAAEVQRDWLQSTVQNYLDEANRLTQLAAKMAPAWMIPFAADAPTAAGKGHTAPPNENGRPTG